MAKNKFIIETDPATSRFRIVAPDDLATEWYDPGELASTDYQGRMYFCTDVASTGEEGYPGMAPGVVYQMGATMQTEAVEWDGEDGEEEGADEEDDDGPECPSCEEPLELDEGVAIDDRLTCGACNADLIVTQVDPEVVLEIEGPGDDGGGGEAVAA